MSYNQDFQIPDLDYLITGSRDAAIQSEVFPSLIVVFLMAVDAQLEDQVVTIIRN